MTIENDEIWFVQLEGGAVRALTLDELDEAYQAGTIDEATLVRRDDSTRWHTLAAVLGGEASEAHPPSTMHESMASLSPIATSVTDVMPASTPPVALDALDAPRATAIDDDDLTPPAFGAGRKRAAVIGAVAVVGVLGAVAFTAVRMGGPSDAFKAASLASKLPVPAAPAAQPDQDQAADAGPRFSEEQRRALADLDKKREAEMAAKRSQRASAPGPSKPIKMGDPFKKGGSKFDPLNGSL